MDYQEINELLAKGVKTENMSSDYAREISCANAYLLKRKGDKPEWLDGFLESNRCKLVETICRAASTSQGISSLQGYSEGYFNEMIQNANDLHCGEDISICVSKNEGSCRIECRYEDRGFELSNIYAFLNREMSDKTGDDSKTGKFGVGIKSFFKFVDCLSIRSNVLFHFNIDRNGMDYDVSGRAMINTFWKDDGTVLSLEYHPALESGYNTEKLTSLIEYLCGDRKMDVLRCFLTGSDEEIVFDIRSLIFLQLNGNAEKNISRLNFEGKAHSVNVYCKEEKIVQTVTVEDENWKIGILSLGTDVDRMTKYKKSYIVFSRDGMSAAFPMSEFSSDKNRMYSTYYLKEDSKEQLLPLGMLIDSRYANIHRNDVGDSEEKINTVYERVRDYMRSLYRFMCSPVAGGLSCAVAISDVFHNMIARYLMVDKKDYWESPLSGAYFDNTFLPKKSNEVTKAYVINHKRKEAYDSAAYQEGDIVKELKENYFEFVEKKNTYDLNELISSPQAVFGVKKVYSMLADPNISISEDNRRIASEILNYFQDVGEYLVFAVTSERRADPFISDAEIDHWLIKLREEVGKYFDAKIFLKLIGRYRLNAAIAYDGSICHTKLSFKDYLFNGILTSDNGILSQYQNQFYDEKYYQLKQELLEKRYLDYGNRRNPYLIRCIRPYGRSATGWNGTYDYCGMDLPQRAFQQLSHPELLLERMAMDDKFTGLWLEGATLKLFETSARGMWQRDYQFKKYTIDYQQIINLSCIKNVKVESFVDFINSIRYRSTLSEQLRKYIHISCREEVVTTKDIAEHILPVMIETPEGESKKYLLDEFEPSDIEIGKILENSNNEIPAENAEFIYKITGYWVHAYRFVSVTRRKILVYSGNGKLAVKTDASKKYREVAKCSLDDKNIYFFYDNISTDMQQAVTSMLKEIGVCTKNPELLEGYIHNGNYTKTMSYLSGRRNLTKVRKKLLLEWADVGETGLSEIQDTEILYRLLTARGSYDIFCPICSDIPLEIFDYGEETRKKHSRKIILMENENPDTSQDVPYIITVACAYCYEKLRSTLMKSEFDGKNVVLTTQIAHGLHEKFMRKQQVELSPVNIEIMKKFKL